MNNENQPDYSQAEIIQTTTYVVSTDGAEFDTMEDAEWHIKKQQIHAATYKYMLKKYPDFIKNEHYYQLRHELLIDWEMSRWEYLNQLETNHE